MAFFSLVVYAIAMLIRPHEWGPLINEETTIVRDSLLLCMLLFLFHQNKNFNAPQLPLMVAMVIVIILSVVMAGWIGGGVQQGELFIRTAFVPFVLISGLVDSLKRQHILFIIIIVASLIMVINGHVQTTSEEGLGLVGNPIYRNGGDTRITYIGFLSDPNDLGMFLLMSLPLIFYYKARVGAFLRLILWLSIAAILYGIFLTNSRGTLLATLTLGFFWFWRKYGTNRAVFAALASSPLVLIVMSSFREISADDESSQGRLDAWYAGYQMLLESPIFGIGQGSFIEYNTLTAHNSFVLAFAELGLVGCIIWVALIVVTAFTLWKIAYRQFLPQDFELSPDQATVVTEESKIALVMLYSLLAYLVTGFFLSRTYVPVLYFYLGMSAACLGRVRMAFPKLETTAFYQVRQVGLFSLAVTIGGIVAVYILIKLFL